MAPGECGLKYHIGPKCGLDPVLSRELIGPRDPRPDFLGLFALHGAYRKAGPHFFGKRLSAEPDTLCCHELRGGFIHQKAMLDALYTRSDRLLDCFRRESMNGDIGAPVLSGLDRGMKLRWGERHHVDRAEGRWNTPACRKLDLRRALHELIAGSNTYIVRAVSDRKCPNLLTAIKLTADLTRQIGELAEISMPAGHRDHGT